MRTLFTFTLLAALTFSGVAFAQEAVDQIGEIAVESIETTDESQTSISDAAEPAPSDAEIDSAPMEAQTIIVDQVTTPIAPITVEYTGQIGASPEVMAGAGIVYQDCGCQSNAIAPVVYQEVMDTGNDVTGAVIEEGASEVAPIADATSVVESPIVESTPMYGDTQGAPMVVEGAPMAAGTPACACNQTAGTPVTMAAEGEVISPAPAINYESAPVIYSTSAPATAPCCTPARRGFFRTLFGR